MPFLLIRFILPLGIPDLSLKIIMAGGFVPPYAIPEGPLRVCVDVHLDYPVADGLPDFFPAGTGSAMENEIHGLGICIEFLLDIILAVVKDLGRQDHVPWLVNPVDISEGSSNRESAAYFAELLKGIGDLFRLGV
jgi:hypothetical protein